MSASSCPPPASHRIGIIMFPAGRFLQCSDCQLSFTFPDGVKFVDLAKQFKLHSCVSPTRKPPGQTDPRLVVLRYEDKVPALASCTKCERTFFTPTKLMRDASGAEEYLGRKFDVHEVERLRDMDGTGTASITPPRTLWFVIMLRASPSPTVLSAPPQSLQCHLRAGFPLPSTM